MPGPFKRYIPDPSKFKLDPKMIEELLLSELFSSKDPETPPSTGAFGPRTPGAYQPGRTPEQQKLIDDWLAANVKNGKIVNDKYQKYHFKPQLLVRAMPGDTGVRPLPASQRPDWSCDVWCLDPSPDQVTEIGWSQSNAYYVYEDSFVTLCTHVWNLGLAPVFGARVEFWESPGPGAAPTRLVGVTRVDLPGRYSRGCHKYVKCPVGFTSQADSTWVTVRVRTFSDAPPDGMWDPSKDRRIAQRLLQQHG